MQVNCHKAIVTRLSRDSIPVWVVTGYINDFKSARPTIMLQHKTLNGSSTVVVLCQFMSFNCMVELLSGMI